MLQNSYAGFLPKVGVFQGRTFVKRLDLDVVGWWDEIRKE